MSWISDFATDVFRGFTSSNAATSLGSSFLGGIGNSVMDALGIGQTARQVKASKELSKYNNEINQATWEKQFNLQNDRQNWLMENGAAMQKQGLINAGLNPAMMQGTPQLAGASSPSGGISSGSSASAFDEFMTMAQFKLQEKLVDSEASLNRAKANEAEANATRTGIENIYLPQQIEANLDYINNQSTESLMRTLKIDAETAKIIQDRLNSMRLTDAQVDKLEASTELDRVNIEYNNEQIKWFAQTAQASIFQMYSSGKCSLAQANFYTEQANEIGNWLRAQVQVAHANYDHFYSLIANLKPDTESKEFDMRVKNELGEDFYESLQKLSKRLTKNTIKYQNEQVDIGHRQVDVQEEQVTVDMFKACVGVATDIIPSFLK